MSQTWLDLRVDICLNLGPCLRFDRRIFRYLGTKISRFDCREDPAIRKRVEMVYNCVVTQRKKLDSMKLHGNMQAGSNCIRMHLFECGGWSLTIINGSMSRCSELLTIHCGIVILISMQVSKIGKLLKNSINQRGKKSSIANGSIQDLEC